MFCISSFLRLLQNHLPNWTILKFKILYDFLFIEKLPLNYVNLYTLGDIVPIKILNTLTVLNLTLLSIWLFFIDFTFSIS